MVHTMLYMAKTTKNQARGWLTLSGTGDEKAYIMASVSTRKLRLDYVCGFS